MKSSEKIPKTPLTELGGRPAFPCMAFWRAPDGYPHPIGEFGISQLDWFAGMALQGLLASDKKFFFKWEHTDGRVKFFRFGKKPRGLGWKMVRTPAGGFANTAYTMGVAMLQEQASRREL